MKPGFIKSKHLHLSAIALFIFLTVTSFQNCSDLAPIRPEIIPFDLSSISGIETNSTGYVFDQSTKLVYQPATYIERSQGSSLAEQVILDPSAGNVDILVVKEGSAEILSRNGKIRIDSLNSNHSGRYLFLRLNSSGIGRVLRYFDLNVLPGSVSLSLSSVAQDTIPISANTDQSLVLLKLNFQEFPGVSIQWFKNGVPLHGENQKTLAAQNLAWYANDKFWAEVNYNGSIIKTSEVTVTGNPNNASCSATQTFINASCTNKVCSENKIQAISNGFKEEKCIQNGTSYGAAQYYCSIIQSQYSTTSGACQCASGQFVYKGRCVNPSTINTQGDCIMGSQIIGNGETITTYLSSSVAYGYECQAQTRTCSNGTLSGNPSSSFTSCSTTPAATCSLNGQTIAHGLSVIAYPSSTVPYGSSCTPETRTCTNGTLSGSGQYSSCSVGGPASCSFNGQTVAHGSSVTAYVAPNATACQAETRVCTNGSLSGSYPYSSCAQVVGCYWHNQYVPHGSTVTAYAETVVNYYETCESKSQVRTCNNGNFTGSFQHKSCEVAEPYYGGDNGGGA